MNHLCWYIEHSDDSRQIEGHIHEHLWNMKKSIRRYILEVATNIFYCDFLNNYVIWLIKMNKFCILDPKVAKYL